MKKIFLYIITGILLITGCAGVEQKAEKLPEAGDGSFEMAVVGDIMPGRRMAALIEEKGIEYIFSGVASVLKDASIVFGNLETPLVYENTESGLKKNGKKSIYLKTAENAAEDFPAELCRSCRSNQAR